MFWDNKKSERGGSMKKKGLLAISILVALLAMSGPVSADIVTYTINLPDSGFTGYTPPYADVIVNRIAPTVANISFASRTTNGITFLMGGPQAADVNVNAASWTFAPLASTVLVGFTNGALTSGGSGTVNSFGVFNQTVNNDNGYTSSHNLIRFQLTNTSSSWLNAGLVLKPNALGFRAAIHGFACTAPCTVAGPVLATGNATTVPESTSLLLLGSGLAGIGLLQWKRRKAGQA